MSNERPAPKQYEAWLIQLLRLRFEQANFKVEDHLKVGELPLEIDMIVITPSEGMSPDFSKLPPLYHYFRRYNVMELKTEADRLEISDLLKLHAYGWLYMMKNNLRKVADMTVTALVHHLTPTVVEALPELGYKPTGKGIFRRDSDMVSHLISFDELPDEVTPEELQAFSNPARRQPIILSQLASGRPSPILEAIFELYESEVQKMIDIKEETLVRLLKGVNQEKLIAAISKTVEQDKLLSAFNKEDMLKQLLSAFNKEEMLKQLLASFSKEDVIAALGDGDVLRSLQAKLGPDQLRKMLDQINGNQSESH